MDILGDVGQIPLQYLSLIQDFLEDPCRFLGTLLSLSFIISLLSLLLLSFQIF